MKFTTSCEPPNLGLLLDVDGPLSNPDTRTIAHESIREDLVMLARIGVPIAFVTGRSSGFFEEVVIPALSVHGLREALATPGAQMFAVFEKGAAWAVIDADGLGPVTVDESVAPPAELCAAVRELVEHDFADVAFYDASKVAMISVEQRVGVDNARFLSRHRAINEAIIRAAQSLGIGIQLEDEAYPDTSGQVPFRFALSIIASDVEAVTLDKDHAARQVVDHFAQSGPLPARWRSVGDSRSDYLMADAMYELGFAVAHLDVRPQDGLLDRPYPVLIEGDLMHDDATAVFLHRWVQLLTADGGGSQG